MKLSPLAKMGRSLALCAALGGCAAAPPPATTVISFTELDCNGCGEDMARALVQLDGVKKTSFDKRKAELTVIADPGVDVFALAQKNKPADEEWKLVLGAGKGSYLPWAQAKDGIDVKEVAKDGEDVPDLAPHLAPGKVTVVDFSAKWCEPCRELDKHLLSLLETDPALAYRKLDVGDWDTPLGQRWLKGVKELPHVLVFDKSGKQVETVSGLDLAKLDGAIRRAAEAK